MYKKLLGQIITIFISLFVLSAFLFGTKVMGKGANVEGIGINYIHIPFVKVPPLKTIFGVEMNPITNFQGLSEMANADSYWVRRNGILWSAVEPVQGAGYDWSALQSIEADFLRARENDLEPIVIVRGVPEWARVQPDGYLCGPIDPAALPAFGEFMYALVQRYSVPPYSITYWEIWNEPDVSPSQLLSGDYPYGCLGDSSDTNYFGGEDYAEILKIVYPKMKQANANVKVLVGGLLLGCSPILSPASCVPSRYLEGILVAGGQNYFDGISFHAYDFFSKGSTDYQGGIYGNLGWNNGGSGDTLVGDLIPSIVPKTDFINNLLAQYNVQEKILINSETALLCGGHSDPPGGPGCESTLDSDYERIKAAYVPQSYASAIAKGLVANIWYSPRGWRNSGLLFDDLTHRPAYDAYVIARNTLKNATFVREIHEFEGDKVFGYEFSVQNEVIWVIWTLDGKQHSIFLSQSPSSVFDELGTPVTMNLGTLSLQGMKTYYVDWTP